MSVEKIEAFRHYLTHPSPVQLSHNKIIADFEKNRLCGFALYAKVVVLA